jgi:hypothetical protein
MPSPGKAFLVGDGPLFSVDDMLGRPDVPDTVSPALVNDYVWAASIFPAPVTLDYTWLVQPLALRPVPPVNSLTVSRSGAGSATVRNATSSDEYGVFDPGQITLDTAIDADTTALATYATTYQPNFLQRPPQLTFDLLPLTTAERWRVLQVTEGTRIILTGTPGTWPAECLSLFVDGIAHTIGVDQRLVVFTCSPLIGQAAGQVGPWFTADRSMTAGSDAAPF